MALWWLCDDFGTGDDYFFMNLAWMCDDCEKLGWLWGAFNLGTLQSSFSWIQVAALKNLLA